MLFGFLVFGLALNAQVDGLRDGRVCPPEPEVFALDVELGQQQLEGRGKEIGVNFGYGSDGAGTCSPMLSITRCPSAGTAFFSASTPINGT